MSISILLHIRIISQYLFWVTLFQFTLWFCKILFNIIISTIPTYANMPLPWSFQNKIVYAYFLMPCIHIICPPHLFTLIKHRMVSKYAENNTNDQLLYLNVILSHCSVYAQQSYYWTFMEIAQTLCSILVINMNVTQTNVFFILKK